MRTRTEGAAGGREVRELGPAVPRVPRHLGGAVPAPEQLAEGGRAATSCRPVLLVPPSPSVSPTFVSPQLHITSQTSAGEVVKLVVLEMNDVSRGVLGGSAAFCYGEEQLEHFGLVFASEESERWLPDDFLPLSLHAARPEGRFYVRIKETSPLVLQFGPATTV